MDLGTIRRQLEVVGSDGEPFGAVDHNRIKLRRNDPAAGGQHHWPPQAATGEFESNTVRLAMAADQARRFSAAEGAARDQG